MSKYNWSVEDVSMEAVLNKLGGVEGARRFLRGELEIREVRIAPVANIDLGRFYELCGLSKEYKEAKSRLAVPEDLAFWDLLMLKELTFEKIIQAYEKAGVKLETFGVNLQEAIDPKEEQRDPAKGTYLVSFRRNVEADEENKNQSANQRREQKYQDITLMERLILGLAYFLATKQHLDVKKITLCAGSRVRDGSVPSVYFDPDCGGVEVDWWNPGLHDGCLRARSAVSRQPEPEKA